MTLTIKPVSRFYNDWFDELINFPLQTVDKRRSQHVNLDVIETTEAFNFIFEVPGLGLSDLKIELQDNYLTVIGEAKLEKTELAKDEKYLSKEIFQKHFKRTVQLDTAIEEKDLKASLKNGLLTISIPKKEKAATKIIPIKEI